jgi:group I intron endonuclease
MVQFKDDIKKSGIYLIKSFINNKKYIGSAISISTRINRGHLKDLRNNKHDNTHLQNHVNKYGINDLQFSILETCPNEKLIEREQYWIDTLKPEFNICKIAGSTLGIKLSEETKNKMKASNKRFYKGKERPEIKGSKNPMNNIEFKQKMMTSLRKYWDNKENRKKRGERLKGVNTWTKNRIVSESTREKLRNNLKLRKPPTLGKKLSPRTEEHRRKLSQAKQKYMQTEEGKAFFKRLRKIHAEKFSEIKIKLIEGNRIYWSNPENREKQRQISRTRMLAKNDVRDSVKQIIYQAIE